MTESTEILSMNAKVV